MHCFMWLNCCNLEFFCNRFHDNRVDDRVKIVVVCSFKLWCHNHVFACLFSDIFIKRFCSSAKSSFDTMNPVQLLNMIRYGGLEMPPAPPAHAPPAQGPQQQEAELGWLQRHQLLVGLVVDPLVFSLLQIVGPRVMEWAWPVPQPDLPKTLFDALGWRKTHSTAPSK